MIRSYPGAHTPDVQIMFADVPLRAGKLPGPAVGEGYTLATSLMLPRSRGTVRLAGAEPGIPPLIDPNYYADPSDLHAFAAGLRAAREIGSAVALDEWRDEEVLPGPGVNDDASLRAYLRRNLSTYANPGGTCRIGSDAAAVVGTDLRVHGIGGLRVADASVMPSAPSANANATVYAIAERAAALIQAQSAAAPSPSADHPTGAQPVLART